MSRRPLHQRVLLLRPRLIAEGLAEVEALGILERTPNLWQLELGVVRMWHRILFRSETVGTCVDGRPRRTLRARLLDHRAVRFPFLVRERAIAPWDLTGLLSDREQIIRHLLGAHHDGVQFIYDLQVLQRHPGALEELRRRCAAVVDGTDPRAEWLQDLTVYEGYHADLLAGLDRFLGGEQEPDARSAADPDLSFRAWLRWCAEQPATPRETLAAARRGAFGLPRGLAA